MMMMVVTVVMMMLVSGGQSGEQLKNHDFVVVFDHFDDGDGGGDVGDFDGYVGGDVDVGDTYDDGHW